MLRVLANYVRVAILRGDYEISQAIQAGFDVIESSTYHSNLQIHTLFNGYGDKFDEFWLKCQ